MGVDCEGDTEKEILMRKPLFDMCDGLITFKKISGNFTIMAFEPLRAVLLH